MGALAVAALSKVPAAWVLTGLLFLLFGWLPRAVPGHLGVFAVAVVVGEFGPLWDAPQWVMNLSPFVHSRACRPERQSGRTRPTDTDGGRPAGARFRGLAPAGSDNARKPRAGSCWNSGWLTNQGDPPPEWECRYRLKQWSGSRRTQCCRPAVNRSRLRPPTVSSLVAELALPLTATPVATIVSTPADPRRHDGLPSVPARPRGVCPRWRIWRSCVSEHPRHDQCGWDVRGSFRRWQCRGLDLRSAVDFARDRGLPDVWVVGWSFGTDVVLRHGLLPGVRGAILLSPPLFAEDTDLDRWAADGRPLVVMVPQHDDFLPRMRPRPPSRSSLRAIHPRRRCQTPVGGEVHRHRAGPDRHQRDRTTIELPPTWDGPMKNGVTYEAA